jgi:2-iminobutanoate/2-iminopropanoate deaminase
MWKTLVIAAVIILVLMLFPRHSKREVIFTKLAPDPIGQYSQAIKTGHHLFVSGQIALNKNGVLDTSSIENESRQVLNNIKAIIEAADMKMNQISKASIF